MENISFHLFLQELQSRTIFNLIPRVRESVPPPFSLPHLPAPSGAAIAQKPRFMLVETVKIAFFASESRFFLPNHSFSYLFCGDHKRYRRRHGGDRRKNGETTTFDPNLPIFGLSIFQYISNP